MTLGIIPYGEAQDIGKIVDELRESKGTDEVIKDLIYFAGRKRMADFLEDNVSDEMDELDRRIVEWIDKLRANE